MTILSVVTDLLQSYGYVAVFAFIALESLGIPLPGESTLIAAALYAGTTQHLNIVTVALTAAAAAIVGDNAGYWLGHVGGQRLADRYGRYVRLDATKLKVGRYVFDRHGAKVVFFGRFVTVLRTYAAFLAGMNKMPWSRFLVWNVAGGAVWTAIYAFGAFVLGSAATQVGQTVTLIGLGVTTMAGAALMLLGRRSIRGLMQRAEAAYPDDEHSATDPAAVLVRS